MISDADSEPSSDAFESTHFSMVERSASVSGRDAVMISRGIGH